MACKVLVHAEHEGGAVREVTYELLAMARKAASEAGWGEGAVKAVLLGQGLDRAAGEIAARGASEVIVMEGPALADYTGDAHHRGLEAVIKEEEPELVLFGHTPNGWDVAPLVAAGLDVPLATECSAITFENGRPLFTRKAFNGKFLQVLDLGDARPRVATVQKGATPAAGPGGQGSVRKVPSVVPEGAARARFVEIKKGVSGGVDLTQAPIIVAGGRGVGSAEKFSVVRDLAEALGGQVGASRPVTDMGWLPHEHQVGSSGVTVNPKLYIACGISGAIQHTVGMRGSGYVVAINKDADAPIFGVADVGVVGDLFEMVPALTKAVKEAKGQG
ncbi:MAG TPA: electron transfer flavoprotein subunit alpha/FixB family protein [Candidatus Polarisedimenticolia bacterium]|nr:electron transfer flavoprotein subunit alpha/FixB family protein [Candidatus Polarisedimenticolia bacterium]